MKHKQMIKKMIILILCVVTLGIVAHEYIKLQKNKMLEDYPAVLGLTNLLRGDDQVRQDLGEPLSIEPYGENEKNGEVWFYDGFSITFYVDGTFRYIEVTGEQYYFTEYKIHVGSSIEEVDEVYKGKDSCKYDNIMSYKDGELQITFIIDNKKVNSMKISYVETYR